MAAINSTIEPLLPRAAVAERVASRIRHPKGPDFATFISSLS